MSLVLVNIKGLSSFITECKTPMTIAIQGDWGSGKTSVMMQVNKILDKSKTLTVEFNTWQYSQFFALNTLSLALIKSILDSFDTNIPNDIDNKKENTKKQEIKKGILGFAKNALVVSTEIVTRSSTLANALDRAIKINDVDDTINGEDDIVSVATLKDQFQEYVDLALEESGKDRVVIFIDDLDRLEPLRAVELLEILKNFLDCKKCVFVLAIDYKVVVSGVKSKYGFDSKEEHKGKNFFDKIIQVPFKMPVPQYNIKDFVKKEFESIANEKCPDEDLNNYEQLISFSIGRNPRSINRLFNSYLLLLKIEDKEILENDDKNGKKSLFAILCMQQQFENLYNFIVLNSQDEKKVNAEFFNNLADEDLCLDTLKNHDIIELNEEDAVNDMMEALKINRFIKCFNETFTGVEGAPIDEEIVNNLRPFLKDSTISDSDLKANNNKKARFYFNDVRYEYMGAGGNNLGKFALDLITHYSKENDDLSAEDLRKSINEEIPCHYDSEINRAGLGQVNCLSDVEENARKLHFDKFPIQLGDDVLLVSKGWGTNQLITLINLLGYKDKIKSNML